MCAFLRYSLLKFHNISDFFYISFWPYFSGPVRLHTIGEYVSQVSFNWLLPCWVFRTGQRTSVLFFGFVFGRLVTQCDNKRIFQQSICVVWLCVYVANFLADNSQELKNLKPRFASSCEYRISSNNNVLYTDGHHQWCFSEGLCTGKKS